MSSLRGIQMDDNLIDQTAKSIKKKKISLASYTEIPNTLSTETHKDSNTEKQHAVKKVKRTFYIPEDIADVFDNLHAKLVLNKRKADKSELIKIALEDLMIKFQDVLNET